MLTRSAAKAFLAKRRETRNNDKLPADVLLEIFDAFRQLLLNEYDYHDYERVWNSTYGWFKLAHVCQHWRRVVLSSSSHLRAHLLFTRYRTLWEPMLKCLPQFPVLFDYCDELVLEGPEDEDSLALAIIEHRSRVRGIALQTPHTTSIFEALCHHFPKLESLKIEMGSFERFEPAPKLVLPAGFLSGSAPLCLRRLTLQEVEPESLSPLLSSATGLEELALTLRVGYHSVPEDPFMEDLLRLSCLRSLELKLFYRNRIHAESAAYAELSDEAEDVVPVPLSRLTDFVFTGHGFYLKMLLDRLTAPSLQHLVIECFHVSTATIYPLPQLCKLLCDSEFQFKTVCLAFLNPNVEFFAKTFSDHARPSRICMPGPHIPLEQFAQMLSGPLSTVEELSTEWETWTRSRPPDVQWRGLFNHVPNVKKVQVQSELALGVARSFQPDGQLTPDLLPHLEQVKVDVPFVVSEWYSANDFESICDAFKPLMDARQQAGRPVRLSESRAVVSG